MFYNNFTLSGLKHKFPETPTRLALEGLGEDGLYYFNNIIDYQ